MNKQEVLIIEVLSLSEALAWFIHGYKLRFKSYSSSFLLVSRLVPTLSIY